MRAKIGALAMATASMICGRPRPSHATIPIASRMPGIDEHHVDDPHQDGVHLAAERRPPARRSGRR